MSQPPRLNKLQQHEVPPATQSSPLPLQAAPRPTDNVWEKRAEERESAERERIAQRDNLHQTKLQHIPAVGEQICMWNPIQDSEFCSPLKAVTLRLKFCEYKCR